jgi:hypothetical protein
MLEGIVAEDEEEEEEEDLTLGGPSLPSNFVQDKNGHQDSSK